MQSICWLLSEDRREDSAQAGQFSTVLIPSQWLLPRRLADQDFGLVSCNNAIERVGSRSGKPMNFGTGKSNFDSRFFAFHLYRESDAEEILKLDPN